MSRDDRRRVRWFFAGLLVVSAFINLLGTLLVHHQSRTALLESLLPSSISLGGRTGVVLSSLCLLFLARGVARGKRVAWQLTCALLVASIAFDLVKDIDLEDAILAGWILCGLWWLRSDFTADSNPTSLRRGFLMFGAATMVAALYAIGGALVLGGELSPGFGVKRTLEHQVESMLASPVEYTALTHRAAWFLDSLPVVTYGLVIVGLLQLLRPAIAPRPGPTDRDDAENLVERWGRNRISRLALYGPTSYYRPAADSMVPFTLQGRTALVLGDPVGDPRSLRKLVEEFSAYCERQDWIPAFYQVDDRDTYRSLGMALVRLGSEAMLRPADFTLAGRARHDLRYAVRRCERAGVRITFHTGAGAWSRFESEIKAVSDLWLESRGGPELRYSLGTLATLRDPDITLAVATSSGGRIEGFASWLPVPVRKGWTLDLMRRRPDAVYGVMEALIAQSIFEAGRRGVEEVSLGLVPLRIAQDDDTAGVGGLMKAAYWGVNRFQRGESLHRFKEKFGPVWEDRYLALPSSLVLPEVLAALARAHLPRALRLALQIARRKPVSRSRRTRLSPAA